MSTASTQGTASVQELLAASGEHEALLTRAQALWTRLIGPVDADDNFQRAFTGWGSHDNDEVWSRILGAEGEVVRQLATGQLKIPDNKPGEELTQEQRLAKAQQQQLAKLRRFVADVNELRTIRCAVEVMDTGRLSVTSIPGCEEMDPVTGPERTDDHAGGNQALVPVDHAGRVAQTMASRRAEEQLLSAGGRVAAMARASADKPLQPSGKVLGIDPAATAAVGLGAGASRDLLADLGESKGKVDRLDKALLKLMMAYAQDLLDRAGVRVSGSLSQPAVFSAAMVLVMRSAGVPGLTLTDEGEMLVELLGAAGDLERGATTDARLEVLGNRMERMDKYLRLTSQHLAQMERNQVMDNMVGAYVLAEQVRLVRPGYDQNVEKVDLADPMVLSLIEHLRSQAYTEWQRRTDAAGRPNTELARQRRATEIEQARAEAEVEADTG